MAVPGLENLRFHQVYLVGGKDNFSPCLSPWDDLSEGVQELRHPMVGGGVVFHGHGEKPEVGDVIEGMVVREVGDSVGEIGYRVGIRVYDNENEEEKGWLAWLFGE